MCLLSVVSWGPVRAEHHHRPELNILAQTCACDFGMTSVACSVLSLCCEEPTKKEQYPKLKLIEKSMESQSGQDRTIRFNHYNVTE